MRKHLQFTVRMTLFLLVFGGVLHSAMAQDRNELNGTVLSAGEEAIPLPFINVVVKGTNRGTTTNMDGEFTIEAAPDEILVFTYLGYKTKEIEIGNETNISIELEEDVSGLDEVVVTGYSKQEKKSITGAISTVTSEDLEKARGGATVSSGLAGKIPGVSFRMSDGRPGAGAAIQIRNMGTPLYVIDGVQQDEGQFNNISPNDIESITVLKT